MMSLLLKGACILLDQEYKALERGQAASSCSPEEQRLHGAVDQRSKYP